MATHNDFGLLGEKKACAYLVSNGYQIICTNWHHEHLEIDIIAQKDETLFFVEVKSRSSEMYGKACDTLTKTKQKRLLIAANAYIQEGCVDKDIQFDLITIVKDRERLVLEHFKDVFTPFQF